MINYIEFEKFCKKDKLKIFSINDLKILFDKFSPLYLKVKINRWKQKGYIKSLKKGLYYFSDIRLDEFEIAAKLIIPSYISLETALSHYSIIPDISAEITSVSTKNTRKFSINNNRYIYLHIKNTLFSDYEYLKEGIFIASPEKVILDFFYFRKPDIKHQFFERLNKEICKNLNFKKMLCISKNYPLYVQKLTNNFKDVIFGRFNKIR